MRDATAELGGIAGREAELALLREFGRVAGGGQALVLEGGPGFGKTTLWEGGAELAWQHGRRVLTARASGAETQLSFAALIDVLDGIEGEELAELPPPQAHALDVALFRAPPDDAPPEAHAIGLGLLNALRLLASREPLVIAIDDVQWLDSESAEALGFAARRLTDEPIGFLLARRPGPASALERALDERTLTRVAVGPVTLATVRRILSERLALSLPRHVLRRLFEATVGNPLFALEVGRTLAASGPPAIGEGIPVPATVEDLLGTRVEQLADSVRELLLAVALSADLRVSQLEAIGDPVGLARAVEEGVLIVDGRRVRPAHPLLAAAAIARASIPEQEALHAKLAGVVVDEERRALHLAHATHRPEEGLATTVADAAGSAWARGARQEAAALADHALRLTPRGSPERAERLLTLAGYLEVAGDLQRIDELLGPELDSLPPGAARVRGWLLLAEGSSVRSFADLDRHLDAALAECRGDPILLAHVLTRKADHSAASAVVRIPAAEAWALEALRAVPQAGPDVERRALMALAWARALRGWAIDDLVERYRSVSDEASYIAASPERVAGQRRVWRGDVLGARATFVRLRALADERGEPISYALSRLHMCELELRVGRWDDAEHLLDEWAQSSDGELLIWPMYERCRALLAAGRGDAEAAERWAADALARAEQSGAGWDELEAGRAAGIAALLAHDPALAAERLGAVWDHLQREGVEEPGAFPVAPDLVEAHLALDAPAHAALVTGRLRALADEHEHPWARAGATRSEALIALSAEPYDEAAAASLADAAADYAALGLPVEQARTLLALGRAQRRFKKWGAARESLQACAEAFDALGSPGWAAQARSELERVGARRPPPGGGLTPTERRVAELAAEGLSNKEIARTLFVTVHTVEKHLSKAYAKLGIRSRGELGRSLSG